MSFLMVERDTSLFMPATYELQSRGFLEEQIWVLVFAWAFLYSMKSFWSFVTLYVRKAFLRAGSCLGFWTLDERGIEDLAAWRVTFMNAARASSMFYVSGKEEVSYLFIYLKVFILWSSVRFENRGQSAFCVIHLAGLLERGSSLSEVRIIGKWSMTHKSEWVDHAREGDKEMNKVLGRLRRVYRE